MDIETILRRTLKPALGCTEPVAVALAVSAAAQATAGWTPDAAGVAPVRELDPDDVVSVRLLVNNNIFKNAFSVYIPNAAGHKGIRMAAALGIWCDPGLGLGLFRDIRDAEVARARRLIQQGKVLVDIVAADHTALFVEARVKLRRGSAVNEGAALIQDEHTNLVLLRNDGREVFRRIAPALPGNSDDGSRDFTDLGFADLVSLADNLPRTAHALLRKTIELNLHAAETGLEQPLGLGVGYYGTRLPDVRGSARDLASGAAAGSDARMSGYPVEVMSSAGSGNQGIIATVPVYTYCRANGIDDGRMLRALALSHLVTMYVTSHVGYLSTLCGVAVKAGIGAACGITYAMGGREARIGLAVKIMAATLSGVICDGAKLGCALKVSSAADMAVKAASMAMNGMDVSDENGIVAETPEKTIRNLARLNQSMRSVEDRIVEIMREKLEAGT